jgi:hypothetical protein
VLLGDGGDEAMGVEADGSEEVGHLIYLGAAVEDCDSRGFVRRFLTPEGQFEGR